MVVGNGHGLNELTNRLLAVGQRLLGEHTNKWELYPGPFGLYARHCDDAQLLNSQPLIDLYNDYVRQDVDLNDDPRVISNIDVFLQLYQEECRRIDDNAYFLSYYINTVDTYKILEEYSNQTQNLCSSYMNMKNPMLREHFILMEYSTGAADDVDYDNPATLEDLCRSIYKRYVYQEEMLATYASDERIAIIDLEKIFAKDFSDMDCLFDQDDDINYSGMASVIDNYTFTNQTSNHPLVQQVKSMTWQEVLDISGVLS